MASNDDQSCGSIQEQTTDTNSHTESPTENVSQNASALDDAGCATCSAESANTDPPADSGGDNGNAASAQLENCDICETVTFTVIYNKQKYDVEFGLNKTIMDLKKHVQTLTGVPSTMQKIMFKGLAKDDVMLQDLKVVKGSKLMVVGSTMNDVLQVTNTPTTKELLEEEKAVTSKEPLSTQKQHKKVLDKYGKPDDVLPGVKNKKEPLPQVPLTGMYNKAGGKVRLTFKMELDQIWLGTKERTEKLPMNSIKAVVSEPIVGHEDYHMLALQLGPTEASRYWIYWVPSQYVDAIKDTVLGKWQLF